MHPFTMRYNKLQLNPDKTELILITSKHNQKSLSLPFSVDLNGILIHLSSTVRNLGVTLDQNLSFQQHVYRTCQFCYFELRRINSIRHYLSQGAHKTLISAFVLSRIDYCNSLAHSQTSKRSEQCCKAHLSNSWVCSHISRPSHSSLASC